MKHKEPFEEANNIDLFIGRVVSECIKHGYEITVREQIDGVGVKDAHIRFDLFTTFGNKSIAGAMERKWRIEMQENVLSYANFIAESLMRSGKEYVRS